MSQITATKGSDINLRLTWEDSGSDPIDLTNQTPSIFDNNLSSSLFTITKENAVNGIMTIAIEGTDGLPVGTHNFRVKITDGDGFSIASQKISLVIT